MLKTRIILVVVAAGLCIALFTLPTVVVENDTAAVGQNSASSANESGADEVDAHNMNLDENDLVKVDSFKTLLSLADNTEKSINFADSLANLYLAAQQYDSAAKFIEIIATLDPSMENKLRAGNTYYEGYGFAMTAEKRRFMAEKARGFFDEVLATDSVNMEIKNKVAMTYLSSENPMQGIMMLREILVDDPENEQALFNLGVLSMQSGQFDRAVERFEQVALLYPENIQAQFFLGVSYLETGQKDQAKAQFERVKKLDDDPAFQASVDSYLEDIE